MAQGLVELIEGVRLEVGDLAATRAFYEPIFRHALGEWEEHGRELTFRGLQQSIEFVQRARPRVLTDSGQHQAYRVPRERLLPLVDELRRSGHTTEWWREDHPSERSPMPYLRDPSGNLVQLMPSDDPSLLLDHAAMEVHAFDYCEGLYVRALGGTVDYYHGWRVEDEQEARGWATGDDPCAPWTRRDNPGWHDFFAQQTSDRNLRVPRPNTQVFVRFGPTYLAMVSATRVRQEPPEAVLEGTPRLILRGSRPAAECREALASFPKPFQAVGAQIYLRDSDGNFAELRCAT